MVDAGAAVGAVVEREVPLLLRWIGVDWWILSEDIPPPYTLSFTQTMAENTTNSNANMADVVMQQKGAEGAGAIPFCGCVCCFSACFTEWPECFGCAGKGNCLCYHATSRACKFPTDDPDDKDMWFLCSRGQSHFGPFQAICSVSNTNTPLQC